MNKLLEGIKVVEHGTFITGPSTAMLLADLGADVVKVERPVLGDPYRAFDGGLYSPHFQAVNRNKRSVALDTRSAEGRAQFEALIAGADVYIQNFRTGVAERLGAGSEHLQALNPRLVYCSISGFGASGPAWNRPTYDTVAQAASGYLGLTVDPASPKILGPAIADSVTGLYAAQGIMAALLERERTGKGRLVELSMLEAMVHFNADAFQHLFSADLVMQPSSRPRVSQSYVFRCQDGKLLALHMSSPEKFWEGLARAAGLPDLLKDPRFDSREGRIEHQEVLIELLAPVFAERTCAAWCERLTQEDVPHAAVYTTAEVLDDPQARHLDMVVEAEHARMGRFRTVRSPFRFDGTYSRSVTPPPVLGEHNDELRTGWCAND